jgi:hypothetical protein
MKQQKQYKRYIPTLLKQELDNIQHPRMDNLYVIIDMISRKEIYYKTELQKKYGFTEISKKQFKELISSSDNLQKDLDFLVENKFILRNDYFIIGIKSKSYKIPVEYLGKLVPVQIENKNINKRIFEQIKRYLIIKDKSLEFARTEYIKSFKVDVAGANKAILEKTLTEIKELSIKKKLDLSHREVLDIISCKNKYLRNRVLLTSLNQDPELNHILHRYMIYSTRLNAIADGYLFFKRNETNGRLDSNLTSLPSFLRPFIVGDERLVYVDIKNSQPFFLYTLMKNKTEVEENELNLYADLVVNGNLYEFLKEEYQNQTGYYRTRKQMKVMLFKILYSKIISFPKYKYFFGKRFPQIMQHINNTNSDKHNTLSVQLQSIESFLVLDVIMPILAQKKIIPFTIHDGFICKESEVEILKEIITSKSIEMYGIAPAMHTNFLDEIEEEEEDDGISWADILEDDEDDED